MPKGSRQRNSLNPGLLAFEGVLPQQALGGECFLSLPRMPKRPNSHPTTLECPVPQNQQLSQSPSSLQRRLLPSSCCSPLTSALPSPFPRTPLPTPTLGPAELGVDKEGGSEPLHSPLSAPAWPQGTGGFLCRMAMAMAPPRWAGCDRLHDSFKRPGSARRPRSCLCPSSCGPK